MDSRTIKIYIFYCANSLNEDELTHFRDKQKAVAFKEIRLPCSGKVNIPYLVKAFEAGADGVIIVTCKQDECRHLEGNMRAQRRVKAVDSLMEEIGLGSGRIIVVQLKDDGVEQVISEVEDFCTKVRSMPESVSKQQMIPESADVSILPIHDHQETAS